MQFINIRMSEFMALRAFHWHSWKAYKNVNNYLPQTSRKM